VSDGDIQPSLDHIIDVLHQWDSPTLPDLIRWMATIHMMQADVIQGERRLREDAEAELRDRELHHFEVEQENARLQAEVTQLKNLLGSDE
jgi:hypothetical protein